MYVVKRVRGRDPLRIQREMEEVFRALIPGRPAFAAGVSNVWRPPLEVYETDQALVVRAEIAGMDQERLEVGVEGDRLTIYGERPDRPHAERRSYHEAHVVYGAFGADVFLPFPIDVDRAEAEYRDGILQITLPRQAARLIVARRAGEVAVGAGGEGASLPQTSVRDEDGGA